MNMELKFDSSLKEFCLGLTTSEIKNEFKNNFLEQTHHIYANNVFYKCAIDDDVCTDLWIDWEATEKVPTMAQIVSLYKQAKLSHEAAVRRMVDVLI